MNNPSARPTGLSPTSAPFASLGSSGFEESSLGFEGGDYHSQEDAPSTFRRTWDRAGLLQLRNQAKLELTDGLRPITFSNRYILWTFAGQFLCAIPVLGTIENIS